jgi:hypothetical protein
MREDPARVEKFARLRAAQAEGLGPRVAELLLIGWPAPDGPTYYATRIAADLLDYQPLLDRLAGPIELRLNGGVFLDVTHDAGISDDTIDLDFWDGDNELTRLLFQHGAGMRAELFYYFPDEDLLLSEWWGHVQPPSTVAIDRVRTVAASGFRSANLPMPARAFFTGCQAVFGGLLKTQAEIDEGDCPYNQHLGGSVATTPADWTVNNLNGTPGANGQYLKTAGGDAWNCGASHAVPVSAGDATVRATCSAGYTAFGFFSTSSPQSGNSDCYAVLQFNPDHTVTIKYLGTQQRTNVATWTTPAAPPTSIPFTAFWKLSDLSDSLGARTLTNNNGVTFIAGKLGNAAHFIAANSQSLSITDPALQPPSTAYCFNGWFKRGSTTAATRTLAGLITTDGTNGWILRIDTTQNLVFYHIAGAAYSVQGPVITDTNWHHVICWFDPADNNIRIRVDGGAVVAAVVPGGIPTITGRPFSLGAIVVAAAQDFFDGDLDACGFGPFAPTTAQQDSLYNAGAGIEIDPPGPAPTAETFEIQLRAGAFHFYKLATELALDLVVPAPVYPLYLGVAVYNQGSGLATCLLNVGSAGSGPAFGKLDPTTGAPFTDCPRNRPQVCIDRLGDSLSYLAFDTVAESHLVNETKGPNLTVTSRGNETNLKRPLRVIAGKRHVSDLDLLAFVVEPNTKHPDEGSVKCLFAACEGPVKSITTGKINGTTIAPQHSNYRAGEKRQGQTSFSPNILNYNGTALFLGVAQGDFSKAGASDLRGEVDVEGLRDVRVYTDVDHYTEQFSTSRAWWLLHMLRNKRWGYGLDSARVNVQDFIDLDLWFREVVAQKDKDGNDTTGPRSQFSAELIDRTAQQQIADLCLAGRVGLPFPDRGLLRVVPLRRASELFSATVFTDKAFWGTLNRRATTTELNAWRDALFAARESSQEALLAECTARNASLFHSSEYTARARTDPEFVTDCYHAYLRREPEPAGVAAWLAVVASSGRDAVLSGFAGSQEYITDCTDQPVATFTDRGELRNICLDQEQSAGGKSSLTFSMESDADLPNRIVLTYDDETQQNSQIPLTFEDVDQQLRAGRSFGDTSRRSVERPYSAFGVTSIGEAGRLGNLLLDLGEYDEGGTKNNLRVEFVAWYFDAVELIKYQIIEVDSAKLDLINLQRTAQNLEPFNYFRIRSIRRQSDLKVEISAQAYPVEYYDRLELLTLGPVMPPSPEGEGGFDPNDPNGPARGRVPFPVPLESVGHNTDQIFFTVGAQPNVTRLRRRGGG